MKRITITAFLLCLLVSLCGCSLSGGINAKVDFSALQATQSNINDCTTDTFCIAHDILFYSRNDYNSGRNIYAAQNGKTVNVLKSADLGEDYIFYSFTVFGSKGYFMTFCRSESKYIIFEYEFESGEYNPICKLEDVESWAIAEGSVIYLHRYNTWDGTQSSELKCYDLASGEDTVLGVRIEGYDITDGTVRFINYEDGEYKLKEYDPENKLTNTTASISGDIQDYSYCFTSNCVIMTSDSGSECRVLWPDEKNEKKYDFPFYIKTLILAESGYSYSLACSENSDDEYNVYKINLLNGEYQRGETELNSQNDLYVGGDKLYISFEERTVMDPHRLVLYNYSLDGGIEKQAFKNTDLSPLSVFLKWS